MRMYRYTRDAPGGAFACPGGSEVARIAYMTGLSSLQCTFRLSYPHPTHRHHPTTTLSGTVTMFERVFKKKDSSDEPPSSYSELARRNRVAVSLDSSPRQLKAYTNQKQKAAEQSSRRPRTAPGASDSNASVSLHLTPICDLMLSAHQHLGSTYSPPPQF